MDALSNDLKEPNAEKLVIEGSDKREMIRTIKHVLKKFEDEEYEAQASEIYAISVNNLALMKKTKKELKNNVGNSNHSN